MQYLKALLNINGGLNEDGICGQGEGEEEEQEEEEEEEGKGHT